MVTVVKQVKDDEFIIGEEDEKKKPGAEAQDEHEEETSDNKDAPDTEDDEDEGDEGSSNEDDSSDDITEEEREAIRERRRIERQNKKEHRKQREEQWRREINALRREREDMAQRLAILERKTTGSELAQIDTAIEESERVAEVLKQQIQTATEANDGVAMAEATDRFYQVRRRAEDLKRLKQVAVNNTQQSVQQPQQLDPSLKQHAQSWMSKNTWYDPQGRDADSRVALTIDRTLAEEGWDPRQPEFWQELSSRLKTYLPHRFAKQPASQREKPRSITGGSGRDSGGGSGGFQFKLSPERVAAMKDAGIWDDPVARDKMIKKYAEFDKSSKE